MKAFSHDIGVEIELERCENINDVSIKGGGTTVFDVKGDGSLRHNGREFVSNPAPIDEIIGGMLHVTKVAERAGAVASIRTGFHVHTGVRGITLEGARRIFAFGLIVDAIGKKLWPKRMHNTYCKEEVLLQHHAFLRDMHHTKWSHRKSCQLSTRYSPINVSSIAKHGTLEFRRGAMWGDWETLYTHDLNEAPIDIDRPIVYATAVHAARVLGVNPKWRKAADQLYSSVNMSRYVEYSIQADMLGAMQDKINGVLKHVEESGAPTLSHSVCGAIVKDIRETKAEQTSTGLSPPSFNASLDVGGMSF